MSFPNVIYGDYGDEKVSQSAAIGGLPLGQNMILPDGRGYRHARCGGTTALGAGVIVASSAEVAGHGGIAGSGLLASTTVTDNPVGATAIVLLAKTAAVTTDQFAGGVLVPVGPAASAQLGHSYRIASNLSSANAATLLITLEKGDGLKIAASAGVTLHALRKSPFDQAIVQAAAAIGNEIGVTNVAVSASHYFWAQRTGYCSIEQGASVCVAGSGAAVGGQAGSVTLAVAASSVVSPVIGKAVHAAAASEAVLIDLQME